MRIMSVESAEPSRLTAGLATRQLQCNTIGDAGAEAIAAMLRTNHSLTKLDLRGNNIGVAGKKAVREAVEGREAEGFGLDLYL